MYKIKNELKGFYMDKKDLDLIKKFVKPTGFNYPTKIILKGNPKSTQTIYKSTCRGGFSNTYMSAEGKALKEQYHWEVKSQWRKPKLEGNVCLTIGLYFNDKRKRDIDNFNKLTIDSLTGICFEDDSQITELHITKHYDKLNPRVEITLNIAP